MEFPLLISRDLVIEVLHSLSNQTEKSKEKVQGNLMRNKPSSKHTNTQIKIQIRHNDLEFIQRRLRFFKREVFSLWCCALHF